ncbi:MULTISPECIES: dTDP-4-dehydrorhamnose 3,5-epimerase [unclassified Caulobacter]|uniref:dTDP-4-dehydrorhamnose 3,5-epimerase n=1 Tax=unclassified Caulobacter TaxID=2648921 RepID=UPI000D38010F|nr:MULTISPECIES: dTDP-4-dehydrorhamnose 3,5-epimerase [unclassified Caulobacter]PTS88315.1 dTDP-4-dehydrorhamnose 3,5-epimerase [Caulobacter sp. HMWF009]PTT05910.1 dTDP-4-dehydrorhamnose 3,5-epimerase [Caulobacter sp. HMWF025]PTT72947.1 dTDP-4-dehydrorhamnose 3,5-epimerase [Pseudomonas sp. HMWF010]
MKITPLAIPEVLLITPVRHGDERGWFSETFRQSALEEAGFSGGQFVQDNHVRSSKRGIQRGLHFQRPPRAQDKLLRCAVGAIFDVAVDIRRGSPTYGQWVGAELSARNHQQLLVPKGFAHGYTTLTDECEVLYKVSDYYAPEVEDAVRWNDPAIGIDWTLPNSEIRANARDEAATLLADLDSPFTYGVQ